MARKSVAVCACVLMATLSCLGNADAYRVMQLPGWRRPGGRWSAFDWSPSLLSDWSLFPEFESDAFDPWCPWQNQQTMSEGNQLQETSQLDDDALLRQTAARLLQRQREIEKTLGMVAKQQAKLEQRHLTLVQEQDQVQHELNDCERKINKQQTECDHRVNKLASNSKCRKERHNQERKEREPVGRRKEREPVVHPISDSQPGDILALHITGYQPRDLTITTHGNRVVVKGRHSNGCHGDRRSCTVREFERSYTLPHHVAGDQLQATYKDGVLRVSEHPHKLAKQKRHILPIATDNKLQDEDDGVTVETVE